MLGAKRALVQPRSAPSCCKPTTKAQDLPILNVIFFAKPPGLWFNRPNFLKQEVGPGPEIIQSGALCLTLENFYMKKTLVALAAFAAVSAYAQSTVTISGVIKAGVAQTDYSGGGVFLNGMNGALVNKGRGLSVMDGSSQFHIRGSEDLGGGLKANFQIDTRFRTDESPAAAQAGGNTWVGLSGGFGSVQLGKLDTHYGMGADKHGAHATSLQSSSIGLLAYVNGAAIANASRSSNVIRYTSPAFSGFTGQVNYSTAPFGSEGGMGGVGRGQAAHAQLNYSQGPIRAGFSTWGANTENRAFTPATVIPASLGTPRADQRSYTLFGDYSVNKMVSVGLTYNDSAIRGGVIGGAAAETRRTAWSIPVNVNMGPGMIMASYTRANNAELNGVTQLNTGANLISLGYNYELSKRTALGVSYAKVDNKARAAYNLYTLASLGGHPANTVGQSASQLYAGIRHAF